MSDNTEQPAGGGAPRDPWAPPDSRVPLEKPAGDPRQPAVHDQPTVTSMPGAGDGPVPATAPGFGAGAQTGPVPGSGPASGPGEVPPPPVAPNGPGQPVPPAAGQYGYPAAPVPQYGGYPGYPGYGQTPWGGPAPANGLGIAAMVLGIIAVVGFCMWGLGVILGVLALIFGIVGRGRVRRNEATNGGMALAGIILGSIGIVISGAFLALMIWGIASGDFEEGGTTGDQTVYEEPYAS
ncbi:MULTISPECIES: DUF4190 domain-containing protein [unclassified Streptomyces]|uniref:DUF4190 domain-containing protein n=1 Tax=unclassified Streptomyces TaxID=2593676 RepID=UPI002255159B|nr:MULTISPECIES: DUF4190 domain-containing protein [unclassified Streptomyces]WSP57830.1 DUF4190 domain-containing protein [Streptomyces sp. NBC_01241]WSU21433.1 DUF4190 domain-containing protein [Streptomyces sp. NBC_01108]MCX4789744.1 DUF4190 domain-containing protein [Streptomyces sp. NBC_01221]MCX4794555.1 DUF4190 domain-containing protein [Streptomyces sp. NBC_01242]WSJ35896.1 DUF4190 domain-containing protein [Streptomyces sp. NBC_01321]